MEGQGPCGNLHHCLSVADRQGSQSHRSLAMTSEFKLGNRKFFFRMKPHFPSKVTKEFLLVDLLNNLESLAEDPAEVLKNVALKVCTMDTRKLKRDVLKYGNAKTKKILNPLLESPTKQDVS